MWLRWEEAVSGGPSFASSGGMLTLTTDNLALLGACCLQWIWLCWEQAGSGGMLTLTSLTIWLRWEQAVSGGSGCAGSSQLGFAGSNLLAVECVTGVLRYPGLILAQPYVLFLIKILDNLSSYFLKPLVSDC
jgi:hypothetical protein